MSEFLLTMCMIAGRRAAILSAIRVQSVDRD